MIQKTQRTPGEWRAVNGLCGGKYEIIGYAAHTRGMEKKEVPQAEFEANARLFAAAPELLQALLDIAEDCRTAIKSKNFADFDFAVHRAEEVAVEMIAKAGGAQ